MLYIASLFLAAALALGGAAAGLSLAMPEYNDSLGNETDENKLKGIYLLEQSAAREDNLIIYGSSELRTFNIPQNPANFFERKRGGMQVNLFGRGSCQSIIHALSIISSGGTLEGKKIVLITSPQSYVPEGIAPDLFFANFSELQYLTMMLDREIGEDFKLEFSERLHSLIGQYEADYGKLSGIDASRLMCGSYFETGGAVRRALLTPYFLTAKNIAGLKDLFDSKRLLEGAEEMGAAPGEIDWEAERSLALEQAAAASAGNEFGIEDGYYKTYIGSRLAMQQDKDRNLSYSKSVEYDDLRLLLEACRAKGVEAMFIHVPLHGDWSDYTGFTAERRQEYYQKVADIVGDYDVELLDLTGNEYEKYYLSDVMHLGWLGWLEADEEIYRFFEQGQ